MKYLRHIGLVSSLVIGGVLVGLMAALPSEAGTPTLTIDGNSVPLTLGGPNCPSPPDKYYNGTTNGAPLSTTTDGFGNPVNAIIGCYSINGTAFGTTLRVGNWYVTSASSTNQARVLVNDTTGTDNLKLTGIVITSAINVTNTTNIVSSTTTPAPDGTPCTACQVGVVTIQNTYDASGGKSVEGTYKWGMGNTGQWVQGGSENALNNRFRLIGTVCYDNGCTIPTRSGSPLAGTNSLNVGTGTIATLDKGVVTSTSTVIVTYVTQDNTSGGVPTLTTTCNSSNTHLCTPTIRYDYIIWIQGKDSLKLTDSVTGCGGSCNPLQAVTTPPKKAILFCGTSEAVDGTAYAGSLTDRCIKSIQQNVADEVLQAERDGAKPAQLCTGTCIIITVTGTPVSRAAGKQFFFTATGSGVNNFDITLDAYATGGYTFSNLAADTNPTPGDPTDRFFAITAPIPDGGSQGPFQTDQINCTSQLNTSTGTNTTTWVVGTEPKNSSTKISLTVLTLGQNDLLTCDWHEH